MYDDSGGSNPKRLLIILIVALVIVIGGTILLNGGTSTEIEENNTTVEDQAPVDVNPIASTMVGNTSWGSVTKVGPYGNNSSNVRIALVVGVNQNNLSNNSIVPTLESLNDLKYSYDIYMINVTDASNGNGNQNNAGNMSVNDKSQLLAKEFATPNIINDKYTCCVDIHSTNDSNSYVFVASEDTVTSKNLVNTISNTTSIGIYTPENPSYVESVSLPILSSDIPSIVYVTDEFYSGGISNEVDEIIHAIDNFVFGSSNSTSNLDTTSNDVNVNTNDNSTSNSTDGDSSNITNPTISGGGSSEVD